MLVELSAGYTAEKNGEERVVPLLPQIKTELLSGSFLISLKILSKDLRGNRYGKRTAAETSPLDTARTWITRSWRDPHHPEGVLINNPNREFTSLAVISLSKYRSSFLIVSVTGERNGLPRYSFGRFGV